MMKDVRIVTDSTADIPAGLREEYDIGIVPLQVSLSGETFEDGAYSQEEFFEKMNAAPQLPTTSQPSVGTVAEAYRKALEGAREIVSIHISSRLSGTLESCHEAAKQFAGRVHVFDSKNLSWGLAWQVLEAARAAAGGKTVADVLAAAEAVRDRVGLIVGFDKLDNLLKGGRIGRVSAFVGGILNFRVLIEVNDEGEFEPLAKVRGASAALERSLDLMQERMMGCTKGRFAVLHAMHEDFAGWLEEQIRQRFEVVELHVIKPGAVITSHTGTGWGLAFLPVE